MRRRLSMIRFIGKSVITLTFSLLLLTAGILPANAESGNCQDFNLAMLVARHSNSDCAVFPVYPGDSNGEIRLYFVECFNPFSFQVNGSVTWNGLAWNYFICECDPETGCEYHHDMKPGTPNTVYWSDSGGCTTTGIQDDHGVIQNPDTWNCEDLGEPTCY